MLQKLKLSLLSLGSLLAVTFGLMAPVAVHAQNAQIQGNLCTGADQLTTTTTTSNTCTLTADTCDFNCVLRKIINIFSIIVGVIAVIMMVYGGFRYITSGGASERVTSAKNTILYAIIGLAIVALAQVIVRFVLQQSTSA